jgi:mono/diheme cytochrome c family protein
MFGDMSMRALVAICLLAACGGPKEGGEHGELLSITVEPANEMIAWTGATETRDYTAIGRWEDGHVGPISSAVFSLDNEGARLGQFTDATFTVSGQAAGKGGVIASVGDITGATSVIVTMHPVNLGPGVAPGSEANFPDSSPTGSMSQSLVYPLDHATMPTSVKAPMLMWEGPSVGGGGDLYRIRIVAGFLTIDTILADTPGFNYLPSATDWQLVKNSVQSGAVTMSIDHWDATNGAHGGAPVEVKLVSAEVVGAIYYWNLGAGEMERIDVNGRAKAIPTPPEYTPEPGNRCVACHTVSRDGRYLSGSLWGGAREGGVFDMSNAAVRNSTPAAPAPTIGPLQIGSTYTQLFSTFNPDATRLMINTPGAALAVIDPFTSQPIATTGTPLPSAQTSHPAWSPDGTMVAFISSCTNAQGNPAGGVDYHNGNLSILPVTGPDSFGPASPIALAGAQGGGLTAPSWPSFSPDSNYIAYGAGTFSRGDAGGTEFPGALFMINKAGGAPTRLDAACGGALRCYLPNFSPFDTGDHFWLIFYSFKDYGNAQSGTKGTRRRQMWITAIDKNKLGTGQDPSSVPYWLPDQDVQTMNMSAFWSLPPPIQ